MTTGYTAPQIVRFDGRAHRTRTYWRVGTYKPDNGTLLLYWLSPRGWLPAGQPDDRRYCRYASEAAARRAIAKL